MRDYSQLYLNTVLVFCQPDEIEFFREQTYAAVIHTNAVGLQNWKPVHLKDMLVIVSKNFRKANSGTGLFSSKTKNAFMAELQAKSPMKIWCPTSDREVLDWNKQFRQHVSHSLRVHSSERWDKIQNHCGLRDDLDLLAAFNAKFEQEWHHEQAKTKFAGRYGSHNV